MKFEKHLKNCGLFATLFRASNGDLYLGCGEKATTLLKCPNGFKPITGSEILNLPYAIDDTLIRGVDVLESAELTRATIPSDGRIADVVRYFSDEFHTRAVGITNADYGLIEKRDYIRIYDPDVDGDAVIDHGYLVIVDLGSDNVIGIIAGVEE